MSLKKKRQSNRKISRFTHFIKEGIQMDNKHEKVSHLSH